MLCKKNDGNQNNYGADFVILEVCFQDILNLQKIIEENNIKYKLFYGMLRYSDE